MSGIFAQLRQDCHNLKFLGGLFIRGYNSLFKNNLILKNR